MKNILNYTEERHIYHLLILLKSIWEREHVIAQHTKKEILLRLHNPVSGLCNLVNYLWKQGLITNKESVKLHRYISENPPFIYAIWRHLFDNFYWKSGLYKPRIKWLNKHIKKNSAKLQFEI